MRKPKPIDHRQQLMRAFDFTEDDLWANRQGKFSAQQEMRGVAKPATSGRSRMIVLTWLVTALILVWAFTGAGLPMQDWGGFYCVFVILGLLSYLWVAIELRKHPLLDWDSKSKPEEEIIERARGSLFRRHVGWMGMEFAIVLRKREFPVTWRQFVTVKPERRYCVYYLQPSMHILSIEWLDDSPFHPNVPYSDDEDDDTFGLADEKPKRDDAPPIIGDDGELREDAR